MDSKKNLYTELALATSLVFIMLATRFWGETPNFQPVMAIALCGGLFFSRVWLRFLVPLAGMLLSDALFLGFYSLPLMLTVYSAILLPAVIGMWIRKQTRPNRLLRVLSVIAGLLGSALFFYVTTNFAVWACTQHYSHDLSGLIQCYVAALFFFKWTVSSNLLFGVSLYFAWNWLSQRQADLVPSQSLLEAKSS